MSKRSHIDSWFIFLSVSTISFHHPTSLTTNEKVHVLLWLEDHEHERILFKGIRAKLSMCLWVHWALHALMLQANNSWVIRDNQQYPKYKEWLLVWTEAPHFYCTSPPPPGNHSTGSLTSGQDHNSVWDYQKDSWLWEDSGRVVLTK